MLPHLIKLNIYKIHAHLAQYTFSTYKPKIQDFVCSV